MSIIEKLNKIDIKDIDLSQIKEKLFQRPDLLGMVIIALVSVLILGKVILGRVSEVQQLKTTIARLESEHQALNILKSSENQLKDSVAKLPQGLNAEALINQITDMAASRNVQIQSFSPAKEENKEIYNQITISLNITGREFKNILKFMHDIESSPHNLRLEKFSCTKPESGENREIITAQIELASIRFNP